LSYPDFMQQFPRAAHPFPGIEGYMVAGEKGLAVFWNFIQDTAVPPHAHGAQWGVVFSGSVDFTIDGVRRVYGPGEEFFIPDGAVHSAFIPAGTRVLDLFADRNRYAAKPAPVET